MKLVQWLCYQIVPLFQQSVDHDEPTATIDSAVAHLIAVVLIMAQFYLWIFQIISLNISLYCWTFKRTYTQDPLHRVMVAGVSSQATAAAVVRWPQRRGSSRTRGSLSLALVKWLVLNSRSRNLPGFASQPANVGGSLLNQSSCICPNCCGMTSGLSPGPFPGLDRWRCTMAMVFWQ